MNYIVGAPIQIFEADLFTLKLRYHTFTEDELFKNLEQLKEIYVFENFSEAENYARSLHKRNSSRRFKYDKFISAPVIGVEFKDLGVLMSAPKVSQKIAYTVYNSLINPNPAYQNQADITYLKLSPSIINSKCIEMINAVFPDSKMPEINFDHTSQCILF